MSAQSLTEILPANVIQNPFDKRWGGIGKWHAVVNGVYIPTNDVITNFPELEQVNVPGDMREAPLAKYPKHQDDNNVTLKVPTSMPEFLTQVSPRILQDQATANPLREVGLTSGPPTLPSHAEWYALKLTANVAVIPRLDFTNPSDVTIYIYDPADSSVTDVTTLAPAGTLNYPNDNSQYIGQISIEDWTPAATFVYDSYTPVKIQLGGVVNSIPSHHIDPALADGDTAVVIGVTYKYQQLANVDDFIFYHNILQSHDISLDLYMALGESPISRIWKVHRFYRATLINSLEFGKGSGDFNEHSFKYAVEANRHYPAAKQQPNSLFDEEYIRLAA